MNLTRSILKPAVLMLILLLLSPHSTSVAQSSSELKEEVVYHSLNGNVSTIQLNSISWNTIDVINEEVYVGSAIVSELSEWDENGAISFTDQFGTREYSIISMNSFYANCDGLTTNPTSYYHGLPNQNTDGFIYYYVNSNNLYLTEVNQFSINSIQINENGLEFNQELKELEGEEIVEPIYKGVWSLDNNVAKFPARQLSRLGLFVDTTVSGSDLMLLCADMFQAHSVLAATFDIVVQIEFIKTIQKQDTSTVAGYGQVDDQLCNNNEMSKYLRSNAYSIMENGHMLSTITSPTSFDDYNRGKYLDHIVYFSDDSYWDWNTYDEDGEETGSARGCASTYTLYPSVVRMHDDDGDSWTYHTYLHEMGHTFGIMHDTSTCTGWIPYLKTASVMGTLDSDDAGYCSYFWRTEQFSTASQAVANDASSSYSVPNLPIQRISSIPLVKTQSNHQLTLLSFHVDLMSDSEGGPTECERFYRSYYHLRNDMATSVSVTEFFIGIRSDYVRGAPGEWDYWLGYDRHTHTLVPGDDYVYMKHSASKSGIGWISDSSTDYNSNTETFTCVQHKDTAYRNHHPNQGGSPAEWRFHVVYNTAGIFSPSYKQYYFADIKFDVGV